MTGWWRGNILNLGIMRIKGSRVRVAGQSFRLKPHSWRCFFDETNSKHFTFACRVMSQDLAEWLSESDEALTLRFFNSYC